MSILSLRCRALDMCTERRYQRSGEKTRHMSNREKNLQVPVCTCIVGRLTYLLGRSIFSLRCRALDMCTKGRRQRSGEKTMHMSDVERNLQVPVCTRIVGRLTYVVAMSIFSLRCRALDICTEGRIQRSGEKTRHMSNREKNQ
jgi:hypothetical protein